jgi:vacuolar-type H+-ATPase subunit D/Vma8
MNWKMKGKHKSGKAGELTIVGPPDEKTARVVAGVTHPGFTVESVEQIESRRSTTVVVDETLDDTTKAPKRK